MRLYAAAPAAVFTAVFTAILCSAAPAAAQFQQQPNRGLGEQFYIEAGLGFWNPTADMSVSSEQFDIPGDNIDFRRDLGLTDTRFRELQLVAHPAKRHKFRYQYIPISYEQSATITRNIVFNGQLYRVGLPVNSRLDWKAHRLGYEYDFISRDRGFGGVILEAKYTNVTAQLASPIITEFASARAPIPAIGGIARVYVVPQASVTFELSGLRIPDSLIEDFQAHYGDLEIYGTYNINRYVAVRGGYRSLDVGYLLERDRGSFMVKGIFFGMVARY